VLATLEMFDNPELSRDTARVLEMVKDRAAPIAAIPGLQSKIWFNNPELGRIGAFLVWRSADALAAFRASEDIDSIAARWGVRRQITDFEIYQSVIDGSITVLK